MRKRGSRVNLRSGALLEIGSLISALLESFYRPDSVKATVIAAIDI
jgi:hypothetical protein